MKIIFVRHGDPDYQRDCLTKLGKKEAKKAAKRLAKLPIIAIYSSPQGRAYETASFLAKRRHLPIEAKDFLMEIPCKVTDNNGEEFDLRDRLISDWSVDPHALERKEWMENPHIKNSDIPAKIKDLNDGLDKILAEHGYHRNRHIYKVERANHDIIVIFAHYGSISACLSHLFEVSPEIIWHHFLCRPSSVTTLVSEERRPGKAIFRMVGYGDVSHLKNNDLKPNLSGQFCECYSDKDQRHD